MRPTDLASIAKLPLVAQQQLQAAGFKVDFQQMDWATLLARRAKKDAPAQGGWNIFLTAWTAGDIANPLSMAMLNAKGQNGWFGWQDEPRLEYLKGRFARTTDVAEKKKIAKITLWTLFIRSGPTSLTEITMLRWLQLLKKLLKASVKGLLSICLHAILKVNLLVTYYLLGFWVNFQRKRSSKPRTLLSYPWDLAGKSGTWWIQTYISQFSRELGSNLIAKQPVDGLLALAETTLRLVLAGLSRVRGQTSLLSTTPIQNKKLR
jgi:hypothetical protein